MTKTKNTKHLIITTSLALILCLATLFGTTFAWFTSSVTSGTNTVASANFNVTLQYSTDGTTWGTLTDTSVLVNSTLTPGQNSGVKYIKVTNTNSYPVVASVSIGDTATDGTNEVKYYSAKSAAAATPSNPSITINSAGDGAGTALADVNLFTNESIPAGNAIIIAIAFELPENATEPGVTNTFKLTVGATQVNA